jgi:uncharacterized protein YbjT (DUF2867 family)
LGKEVAKGLTARGVRVRAMVRDAARAPAGVAETTVADALTPSTLEAAMAGVDTVFSAVGASVLPGMTGWSGYTSVDTPANLNLLAAAKKAGVRRFVYVSVFHTPPMRETPYIAAHEAVVDAVKASGLSFCIVRPTGFFSALGALVDMARSGPLPTLGTGLAKSNPIDDLDLAALCVDAVLSDETEVLAGGPEVLTRTQMNELAFAAWGKPPRMQKAPLGVAKCAGAVMTPFHQRMAQLTQFIASISENDAVAPARGKKTLGEYFKERASRS